MISISSSPVTLILKRIYWAIMDAIPDRLALQLQYFRKFHRWLNIDHPRTFNEKVAWRKIHQRDPRFTVFADKIAVKEQVGKLIGTQHVIPTLWVGSKPEDIPFDTLKPPYVIKVGHGSGENIFVRSLEDINRKEICDKIGLYLSHDYAHVFREWAYCRIPKRILIEPMIDVGKGNVPEDYKFFVFNGCALFIQVDHDRFSQHKMDFFDRDWNKLPLNSGFPEYGPSPRPERLDEMAALAEKIGSLFDFARVDFYHTPKAVLFGEVTFYPGGGLRTFSPPEWDQKFGDCWVISSEKPDGRGTSP